MNASNEQEPREVLNPRALLKAALPEIRARLARLEQTYPTPIILDARKKCETIIERIEEYLE